MALARVGANGSAIELLIADVDGTLVRPDKSLAEETVAAVRELRDRGVRFSVVSSRPPRAMQPLVAALGVDMAIAAFNGGTIVELDGRIDESHRLLAQTAEATLRLFRGTNAETWVFADGKWLITQPDGEYVPLERHTLGYDAEVVRSFDPWLDRIDKIVAASSDPLLLSGLREQANALIAPDALAVMSQTYYLDVTHALANKGDAVAALARSVGVPLDRTAVIGDGDNDVPMFERAGLAIAMGQANDSVRRRADCVTGSNADDGVALAIRQILLRSQHDE